MPLINKKETKEKFYSDLTKGQMVKVITDQKGLTLPALERATKVDIENIAKALKVNANYKGA
jgi:transcriptional regulator of NAD metabolism